MADRPDEPEGQEKLLPQEPATEAEKEWVGDSGIERDAQLTFNYNQQINLVGELVGFKELEDVSPEVRDKAFDYLSVEQKARHQHVLKDQNHQHSMEAKSFDHDMKLQAWGQMLSVVVFISGLVFAGWMMSIGQAVVGIVTILAEVGAVVALVVWGKKVSAQQKRMDEVDTPKDSE